MIICTWHVLARMQSSPPGWHDSVRIGDRKKTPALTTVAERVSILPFILYIYIYINSLYDTHMICNMQVSLPDHVNPNPYVFQPHQQKIQSLVNLPNFTRFHRRKIGILPRLCWTSLFSLVNWVDWTVEMTSHTLVSSVNVYWFKCPNIPQGILLVSPTFSSVILEHNDGDSWATQLKKNIKLNG